jgi:hypothetical protein
MRRPTYVTPYLSGIGPIFENAAKNAVNKLLRGVNPDKLSDIELLGLCSIAEPSLLTQKSVQGDKSAPAEGIPMLEEAMLGVGTMGALLTEVSTEKAIAVEFKDGQVRVVSQ